MAAEQGHGLLQDAHFWVLLATVIFAVVALRKGKKPVLDILDGRTAKIRHDLEEAQRLRGEAQQLLAECQRQHRDALQSAQKIVETARETSARLRAETESMLDETIKRREAQLAERISRAEAAAIADIRNRAVDLAMAATEKILQEQLSRDGGRLVDKAVADLGARAV